MIMIIQFCYVLVSVCRSPRGPQVHQPPAKQRRNVKNRSIRRIVKSFNQNWRKTEEDDDGEEEDEEEEEAIER